MHEGRYSQEWIRELFDRIAGRYDLLNDLLSMGFHRRWKQTAIASLGDVADRTILDAATGTGDIAVRLAKQGARVTGVDFSPEMLKIARKKSAQTLGIEYRQEDILQLTFADATFDHAISTFGVRNFELPERGIQELWRIVKPDGRLVILEFGNWSGLPILKPLMTFLIRTLGTDRQAYAHLLQSSTVFPGGERFVSQFLRPLPTLRACQYRPLFFGLAYLYSATKSGSERASPRRVAPLSTLTKKAPSRLRMLRAFEIDIGND